MLTVNILVHTWWFSENRGSEFSVVYNHVKQMAKFYHLYVIVESCSYRWNDLSEFENIQIENVDFIFIKPNKKIKVLCFLQKFLKGVVAAWFSYTMFKEFEKSVYKYVKQNLFDMIDVIHWLGPVGYHEPGYLWKLRKPYIWGPVSGFENVKTCLRQHYLGHRYIILIKNIINNIATKTGIRVRKGMRSASVVIAATNGNREIIAHNFSPRKLLYFPENVMRICKKQIVSVSDIVAKYHDIETERIHIIWCSSLTARKMPNMLFDILSLLKHKNRFFVDIVGGGEYEWFVKENADILNQYDCAIKICVHGAIPRQDVQTCFKTAHLHLLTSSHEANTTVIWEAMEHCVPTIALNICGMADILKKKYWKIN